MEVDIEKLIERLRMVQHHPAGFIGFLNERSPWMMQCFLFGFEAGASTTGLPSIEETRWVEKAAHRGWKISGDGPVPQMREKGMSELEIVIELVEIEIEALRELQQSARKDLATNGG